MVANVIGRDHGACSKGVLDFKIPLHILRILEIAADVIQLWNGKGALGVEATAKRCRRSGVTTAAGTAGRQTSAASGKCSGSRGCQVEGHISGGHVEQVYLREIRIKQAQETAGVKVGEETHARANDRILTDGAPGQAEPWLEDN